MFFLYCSHSKITYTFAQHHRHGDYQCRYIFSRRRCVEKYSSSNSICHQCWSCKCIYLVFFLDVFVGWRSQNWSLFHKSERRCQGELPLGQSLHIRCKGHQQQNILWNVWILVSYSFLIQHHVVHKRMVRTTIHRSKESYPKNILVNIR